MKYFFSFIFVFVCCLPYLYSQKHIGHADIYVDCVVGLDQQVHLQFFMPNVDTTRTKYITIYTTGSTSKQNRTTLSVASYVDRISIPFPDDENTYYYGKLGSNHRYLVALTDRKGKKIKFYITLDYDSERKTWIVSLPPYSLQYDASPTASRP